MRNYNSKREDLEEEDQGEDVQIFIFPFIFLKDLFGFILILCLYLFQTHFGISSFSHPDNALEVCGLLTPLHIVPEWYF